MARLGDVCNIKSGYAFKSEMFTKNEIPIIRIGNITENGLEIDNDICFDESFWNKNKNYRINKDDVLVAMSGATVGKSCINKHSNKLLLNQRVASISGKNGVENKYVYYFVSSPAFMDYILEQSVGCAQPNISIKQLCAIEFYLPNLKEQKEIVGKLDKVYNLIALRREQLSKLDELAKARFVELFGDPILNPYNWDVVTIGDIVTDVRYGTSKPAVEGGKYPYLRMNNLTYDGHLDLSDMKYIDISDNEIEKCIVRKGDVLFNRTNSIELVGKTCVFDLDEDMVIAGYIIRVRLNDKILPIVLSSYMNSTVLKAQLKNMAKGAVNQANINAQELQSIKIYLPPIELQHQFEDFVKQIDKSKFEVQQSLEKLETLKKSLMQQYFG